MVLIIIFPFLRIMLNHAQQANSIIIHRHHAGNVLQLLPIVRLVLLVEFAQNALIPD